MKNTISTYIFIVIIFFGLSCSEDEISYQIQPCNNTEPVIDTLKNGDGKIFKIGERWLIDITLDEKIFRCLPCNLPDVLKIENRMINLDVILYPIPHNARLLGQPIEILRINS